MAKREKVIIGLSKCSRVHRNLEDCAECPYRLKPGHYAGMECWYRLCDDALALLKEQEPRVMTLEEVKNASVVWLEPIHIDLEVDMPIWFDGWAEPVDSSECRINLYDFGNEVPVETEYSEYGKTWRCWTSRPTEEQKKEVPWDD